MPYENVTRGRRRRQQRRQTGRSLVLGIITVTKIGAEHAQEWRHIRSPHGRSQIVARSVHASVFGVRVAFHSRGALREKIAAGRVNAADVQRISRLKRFVRDYKLTSATGTSTKIAARPVLISAIYVYAVFPTF